MSERIPPHEDIPALVALLSEQIGDVKASIDDLKKDLTGGLRHLEVRLDDHASRLTQLERGEIRREEAERVKAQMWESFERASDNKVQATGLELSSRQVKAAMFGVALACVTFIASEIHSIL
jgi:hypothetical protein